MSDSLDRFIKLLLRSGLITESQLSGLRSQFQGEGPGTQASELAEKLAGSGHLTPFQSRKVRQGKVEDLVVGDYVILEFVGKGGMGQIFKARHALMKREVAIKFTLPDANGKVPQSAIDRFHREVEAASKLSHPNIVSSLDAGQRGEVCYLVMEYVQGTNLTQHIREKGPMAFHQALECLIQASQGLEYSHRKGVVHRDIKPSNLLLTDDGHIKILDMGLVRMRATQEGQVSQNPSEQLTENGQILGTLDFMAPEQALDPHNVDKPADIYSLGCTLYFMLTGTPPFRREGATQMSRLIAHREDPIPLLCKVRADVPKEFEPVFQKMLAKAPLRRYQSLGELIVDLRKIQQRVQSAESALDDTVTMVHPGSGASVTRAGLYVFGVAVVLSLAAGIWFGMKHDSRPSKPGDTLSAVTTAETPAPEPILSRITQPTDLLKALNLATTIVKGSGWQISDGKLTIPSDTPSKLFVPILLPQSFRLLFRIQRKAGEGPFIIGLKDNTRQCYLLIDSLRKNGEVHLSAMGTTNSGRLVMTSENVLTLTADSATELLLDVGENSLSLRNSTGPIMDWKGDFSTLSLGAGWDISNSSGILLGSNDGGTFELQKLEIRPMTEAEFTNSSEEPIR